MIVNRRVFNVKQGCMDQAVELVKAGTEQFSSYTGPIRIYAPETGTFGVLAIEWEYKDLAEYERLWAEWQAAPETAAFMEKWVTLTRSDGTNEIWHLM